MKRKAFICALLLCLSAMGTGTWAQQVSQDEAMQRALKFFSKPSQTSGMKKAPRKAPRMKAAEVNETYYIFNDEANGGFIIVSGEERTPDILGYSNGGRFDAAKVPANMRAWLDGYKAQIKAVAASTMPTATSETYVSRTPIAPLLRTEWNQLSPYNLLCPMDNGKQCVTGCVATAMAQVMNYWQHPAQTTATIPNRVAERLNFTHPDIAAGTAIDWANMPRAEWDATTEAQQKAVSELMLYCGMAVQMDYGANSSAAYSQNVAPALSNYFGYDPGCQLVYRSNYEDWLYIIYNELRQGHPVYYSGKSSSSGHAFVCDGYASEDYYHIDWGWGGDYNGFFRLQVMNPQGRGIGGGSSSDGYANRQGAILGCVPAGHTDTKAALACHSIATSQTTVQRSAATGNFPSVTITPRLFVTTHAAGIDYALALYQDDVQRSLLSSATASARVGDILSNSFSVSISEEVADGEYQIVPVCRKAGESTWQRCLDSDVVYVKAVISGQTLTLTPMDYTTTPISDAKLVCTAAPVITGSYHYTDKFSASFTIRNDGGDYAGPLCIINSTTQDILAEQMVSLAAGETKTVTMTDIVPWSMRTNNTQNHFYLGSYIGDIHVSGSEFALAPFPILRVTTNIPELPEAEDDGYNSYWIYDTKLNATLRIEYPEPDGYAPTVNGKVNVKLSTANSGDVFSTDLDINLKPGQSAEVPLNLPEETISTFYRYILKFSATPILQEDSKSFKIEDNGSPGYHIVVSGGKKVPGWVNYTVSVSPEGAGSVNSNSSDQIILGSEMSITAAPFIHYEGHTYFWNEDFYNMHKYDDDMHIDYYFDHWTKNGVLVSKDNTLTLTMDEDCALVAHFKPNIKLTCIETPTVEGTLETGSTNTYNAVIWNESEEDYEGDVTLTYWTDNIYGSGDAKATSSAHVSIKAGETQSVSLPLRNIAPTIQHIVLYGRLTFSHPKMDIRECNISGSNVEIALYPRIRATFTVLNADADHYIDADSIRLSVQLEKPANCRAYKGTLPISLLWKGKNGGNSNFGTQEINVDFTKEASTVKELTFHSGNSLVHNNYGDLLYDLHFDLPSVWKQDSYGYEYKTECIGDGTIYHLKSDWGTRGRVYVYASSSEGGTVGLKDNNNAGNEEIFFSSGMTAHAHATPATGYYFRCWTDKDGNIVSRNARYTFVTSFKTEGERYALKANFEPGTAPAKRTIRAEAQPYGMGTVTGSDTYYDGEQVTLTATAAKGYDFICWQSQDGTELSTDATYTFTVSQDATYTAVFAVYEEAVIVSAESKTMIYGGEVPELTFKTSGKGTLKGEPELSTEVTSTTMPGTYDIVISRGTSTNRRLTLKNGKMVVRKAPLTIHVDDATMTLGEELPTFNLTASGFVGDDTLESTFSRMPYAYLSGGTPTEPGTYDILINGGTSAYYTVTKETGTLTVTAPVGVESIKADDAATDVYLLSGQKIRAKAKDLHDLPAGAYIIGGKKVVVGR